MHAHLQWCASSGLRKAATLAERRSIKCSMRRLTRQADDIPSRRACKHALIDRLATCLSCSLLWLLTAVVLIDCLYAGMHVSMHPAKAKLPICRHARQHAPGEGKTVVLQARFRQVRQLVFAIRARQYPGSAAPLPPG